jgi:predicted secreted protein
MRELAKGTGRKLSKKAQFHLWVFDWYRNVSPRFSLSRLPDASLTCRHFGIHRSYFYRWKKRYDPKHLSTLENKPTIPKQKREPGYARELVRVVRATREADPSYSAKKIRPILLRERDRASVPSVATLGRLINRENRCFRPDTKGHNKCSKAAQTAHERMRKSIISKRTRRNSLLSSTEARLSVRGEALCLLRHRTLQ